MKVVLGAALYLLLSSTPAVAHDARWSVLHGWNLDPWIAIPLAASGLLYAAGLGCLWRRAGIGRGIAAWQAFAFAAGWMVLLAALLSPLYRLGEGLFVAHMLEHELVMVVAAPLIAVARPFGAMIWAVPRVWRDAIGSAVRDLSRSAPWRAVGNPWSATGLHAFALWLWHAPALYNLVLVDTAMHRLQHLSFFFTALLFWWALVVPRLRRDGYGIAVVCLFVTALHSGFLGILMTVSKYVWYAGQTALSTQWGLTPLEDQQLAGLVMWVPAGLVYTGAALALAGLWIARSADRAGGRNAVAAP